MINGTMDIDVGILDLNAYDAIVTGGMDIDANLTLGTGITSVAGTVDFTLGTIDITGSTLILVPDGAQNLTNAVRPTPCSI